MVNLRMFIVEVTSGLLRSIVVAALMATAAFAQNSTLEVITLKYRTAEQVIPVLQPLLDKSGSLSGMQSQLFVRTTAANLADLKRVLATLDAAPRRLMITVRQDAMLDRDRTVGEVSGRISTGGDDALRARIDSTRTLDSDRNTQNLQVLEGSSAFIRTGQSVPVRQPLVTRTIINGRVVENVSNTVEYRDVTTGFYVLPRLAGDRVTLDINPQRDTLARPEQNLPRGSVNVQQASTTVSGRLGEWIEVGGVVQGVANQQTVILGGTREVSRDNRRILLKVEEIR
jgi:type II secretory pathway component GspD/PulD (secretin)